MKKIIIIAVIIGVILYIYKGRKWGKPLPIVGADPNKPSTTDEPVERIYIGRTISA